MEKIKAPRGTQDILPGKSETWQLIEKLAIENFERSGFSEIRTPIFESTNLFKRAVGESSDIVNKEMYSFNDRSDRSLTLRPEGTASVVRAYIEHGKDREVKPFKAWYRGPMFRYERPQTGRYRQFHQLGIEAIGAKAPHIDAEIIYLGVKLLQELGLKDLSLHINSLGNQNSRNAYRSALLDFLADIKEQTCEDCQRRMEQNPLRVLDCKVEADQKLYTNAPKIHDFFDEESQTNWQAIQKALDELELNIKIIKDPNLVRGLDYYSHCVFEIKSTSSSLGQQSTVLAGGRYDSLVESLGGPAMPAAGWALGIERLALLIEEQASAKENSGYYIISDDGYSAQKLAIELREKLKTKVEFDYDTAKIKKQLEKAVKKKARYAIFYLEQEREKNLLKIKDLDSGEEKEISKEELCHK